MQWAKSLVDEIAEQVYQRIAEHINTAPMLGDKLTFSESEAAERLGIPKHVLKASRERGEIHPLKIGKGYRYGREQLLRWSAGESQSTKGKP